MSQKYQWAQKENVYENELFQNTKDHNPRRKKNQNYAFNQEIIPLSQNQNKRKFQISKFTREKINPRHNRSQMNYFDIERTSPLKNYNQKDRNSQDKYSNIEKRQNARKKCFQIKVNNIDNINDQITNLLDRVKKINRDEQRQQENHQTHGSPARKMYGFRDSKESVKKQMNYNKSQSKNTFDYPSNNFYIEGKLSPPKNQQKPQKYSVNCLRQNNSKSIKLGWNDREKINKYDCKNQFDHIPKQSKKKQNEVKIRDQSELQLIGRRNIKSKSYFYNCKNNQEKFTLNKEEDKLYRDKQIIETPLRSHGNKKTPLKNIKNMDADESIDWQTNIDTKSIDDQILKVKQKLQKSEKERNKIQEKLGNVNYDRSAGIKRDEAQSSKIKTHQATRSPIRVKPNSYQNNQKTNLICLTKKLSIQVQIDLKLKPLRQSFQKYENPNKWKDLKAELKKKNIYLSESDLEEIIRLSPDEHNPFQMNHSPSMLSGVRDLALIYAEAQNFWINELEKIISLEDLKEEGFQISEIDLNKKGYLSIEDLTCFINLHSGSFYRNRDVSMIFKRFQKLEGVPKSGRSSGMQYSTFLNKLTK